MLFSYITLFIFSIIIHLILRMKQDQKELPKELFAVKMYALVTNEPKLQTSGKRRRPKNSPRMIRSWKMPLFCGLMGQLICLVMYWLVSKFLGHQFCRLSFVSYTFSLFVLAKIFFEINFVLLNLNWCCITWLLLKYMIYAVMRSACSRYSERNMLRFWIKCLPALPSHLLIVSTVLVHFLCHLQVASSPDLPLQIPNFWII